MASTIALLPPPLLPAELIASIVERIPFTHTLPWEEYDTWTTAGASAREKDDAALCGAAAALCAYAAQSSSTAQVTLSSPAYECVRTVSEDEQTATTYNYFDFYNHGLEGRVYHRFYIVCMHCTLGAVRWFCAATHSDDDVMGEVGWRNLFLSGAVDNDREAAARWLVEKFGPTMIRYGYHDDLIVDALENFVFTAYRNNNASMVAWFRAMGAPDPETLIKRRAAPVFSELEDEDVDEAAGAAV